MMIVSNRRIDAQWNRGDYTYEKVRRDDRNEKTDVTRENTFSIGFGLI